MKRAQMICALSGKKQEKLHFSAFSAISAVNVYLSMFMLLSWQNGNFSDYLRRYEG